MKNGLYICSGSKSAFHGVEKKVNTQIKVLSKFYYMEKVIVEKEDTNFLKSILWRLPGGSWGANYKKALDEIRCFSEHRQISFFYIRAQMIDRRYVSFLNEIRQTYPKAKILYEIPTLLGDYELLQHKTMWPWFFKEKWNKRYLRKSIDRIVTFSGEDIIYGIPTIKTVNGIDMDMGS